MPTKYGVIVVLGYKNEPDGELHPIAKQRADRAFEMAIENSDLILCTGGVGDKFNRSSFSHGALLRQYLQSKGIARQRFLPVAESRNTYEDGKFCSEILQSTDIANITLVTSDFHIKRGFLWFQLFCPGCVITCVSSTTIASEPELARLIAHENQAIEYFYRDFPETERLDELYDWEHVALTL